MATLAKLEPLVHTDTLQPIRINKNHFIFGRLPDCDYVFSELRSSSRHATILHDASTATFTLKDTASNGTFVNGTKVGKGKSITLQQDDRIAFVRSRLEFKFNIHHSHSPLSRSSRHISNVSILNIDPLDQQSLSLHPTAIMNGHDSPPSPNRKRKIRNAIQSPSNMNADKSPNRNSISSPKSPSIKSEVTSNHNAAARDPGSGPPTKKRKILDLQQSIIPLAPKPEKREDVHQVTKSTKPPIQRVFSLYPLCDDDGDNMMKSNDTTNSMSASNVDSKSNSNSNDNSDTKPNSKPDTKSNGNSNVKTPRLMRAVDVRNLALESSSGLFEGVIALIIAKKSRRLDIIMEQFTRNGGEMYDESDIKQHADLRKEINTVVLNKTMPFIKLMKALQNDKRMISKLHIVTLDWISESMQHRRVRDTKSYIPQCLVKNDAVNIRDINNAPCPAKGTMDIDDRQNENGENGVQYKEEKTSESVSNAVKVPNGAVSGVDSEVAINQEHQLQGDLFVVEQIDDKVLIIRHRDWTSSTKIAALDMDGTLVTTLSGNKFPKNYQDFRLLHDYRMVIQPKLMDLHSNGFSFVLFSNQKVSHLKHKNRAKFEQKIADLKRKIPLIMKQLKEQMGKLIPFVFMAALNDDIYRKPHRGMWEYFKFGDRNMFIFQHLNRHEASQLSAQSFFVGDAAGREVGWKANRRGKADFSCSDRAFAANCNLTFFTPEEFWLKQRKCTKFRWMDLPQILMTAKSAKYPQELVDIGIGGQELVILVGPPGSGKTSLFQKFFAPNGYVHVNRDTLGRMERCEVECDRNLSRGKSVVIDNTSPSVAVRKKFIDIAQRYKVKARCVWINGVDQTLAYHLNVVRWRMDQSKTKIPMIAYRMYQKDFKEPQLVEGFMSILKVPFVFDGTIMDEHEFLLHT